MRFIILFMFAFLSLGVRGQAVDTTHVFTYNCPCPFGDKEGIRTGAISGTISATITVFDGSVNANWDLPLGSGEIIWKRYFFDSVASATWTVTRSGLDTINGLFTSFVINPFEKGLSAYWDGETWIFGG